MSEPEIGWGWRHPWRALSRRALVIMGLALCAVVAIVVVTVLGDQGRAMMIYAGERGQGPWTSLYFKLDVELSLWDSLDEYVRHLLGLRPNVYLAKRKIGELHQVSTADVPYIDIPQLARFLPANRGWSFQIQVYNSPPPIPEIFGGTGAPETRGRFWKASITCMHVRTPSDFRAMTDPCFVGRGVRTRVDVPTYTIYIDDTGHAFRMTKHEVGDKSLGDEPPLDLGTTEAP